MTNRTAPTPSTADGLLEVPAAVLELLKLPALDGLRDAQVRGRECFWCKERRPLTAETAVDLGQQLSPVAGTSSPMRWYPRACRPCTIDRAYPALLGHLRMCEQCVDNTEVCEVGSVLRWLVKEGRR
ncbi:hypothetical protein ACWEQ7_21955 [Streptomyces sp. NPDC004069]